MRIEQGEERSEIDIPVSEVIGEGGEVKILPEVAKYFSIDYKPKKDRLTLVAGGYIGLIPITENLAIEIKPKFPISNLTRIVSIAEDRFNTLEFLSRNYKEVASESPAVFEFMAECLVAELKVLDAEGVLKQYLFCSEESAQIRGRVDINKSVKHLWFHGKFNKVYVSYFGFTADNPFNQLVKYTLNFCIDELSKIDSKSEDLKKTLIEFYSYFESITLYPDRSFEDVVFLAMRENKIPSLRYYYSNLVEICRLIIDKAGVSFDKEGDDVSLRSFTLDMSVTFESYLLNSLRKNRNIFPENTVILDGNKEGRKKFYNQPNDSQADAKPDFIVHRGGKCRLIADAKYKPVSKDTDRYQLISHALSYNANVAVLVLPKTLPAEAPKLKKIGTVGESHSVDVYEYYFDLSDIDLENIEQMFSEKIAFLVA